MKEKIKVLFSCTALFVFLFVAGCIEEKSEYTINPDGSGKVVHKYVLGSISLPMIGGQPSTPQNLLKENVRQTLKESVGIDTWRDISYKLTPEGKTQFKGTAYFKNIRKVNIKSGSASTDLNLAFEAQPYGTIILELKGEEENETAAMPAIPEEQIGQMVAMAKTQYKQTRPMMADAIGGLKSEMIFNLPGSVQEVSNFEKVDSNTVRLVLDGAKMLVMMDEIMADEKMLAEQIRQRKNPLEDGPDDAMNEKLFGEKGPIRTVVSGTVALFDYEAEVAAAKADYTETLKSLGLESMAPPLVEEEIEWKPVAEEVKEKTSVVSAEPDYEKPISAQLRDGFKRELGGDVDGALKIYFGIIANEKAENKDLARTHHRVGVCYLKNGDEEKAIESFVHVTTHFPEQRGPVLKAEKELKKLERSVPVEKPLEEKRDVDFVGTELINDGGIKEKGRGSSFVVVEGHVVKFEALPSDKYLTGVRVYATLVPDKEAEAKEDFKIFLLDDDFQIIDEFVFGLKKFEKGLPKWVTFKIEPKELPLKFAIRLEADKALAVGADAENSGSSFFGSPGEEYVCTDNGDWLIRAIVNDTVPTTTEEN